MDTRTQEQGGPSRPQSHPTVLVLGGGFAGVETAVSLRKAGLPVTLVSERPHLFVYPTSIWVVTGEHRIEQDLVDLTELSRQHGFSLVVGKVERVDAQGKYAVVDGRTLAGDVLVIALGAARKPLPGMDHTVTVWGAPKDTVAVHDRLQALVTNGGGKIAVGFGGNPADPSAMRGGPAFEVMFNIDHWLRSMKLRDRFELTFFAPMPSPGARMGEKAATMAKDRMEAAGVRVRTGKKLEGFDAAGVRLEGGDRVDADVVVYIPGGTGHPVLANAGLPLNAAGFVEVDGTCAVRGVPGVYAVGDVAALEGPEWRAKQGHLAEVMAKVAAKSIVQIAQGRAPTEDYVKSVGIVCLMDMGRDGALVKRDAHGARLIPLPLIGHLAKKAWGYYYRFTKFRFVHWLRWAAGEMFHRRSPGQTRA